MMINLITLPVVLLMGIILGSFYFGGLWLTVRQIPKSKHPVILTLLSLVGRMLVFFWLISKLTPFIYPLTLLIFMIAFLGMRNFLITKVKLSVAIF
jgi:F1F0 ATPase subunit 2